MYFWRRCIWFFFFQKKKGASHQGFFPPPEHFCKITYWFKYIKTLLKNKAALHMTFFEGTVLFGKKGSALLGKIRFFIVRRCSFSIEKKCKFRFSMRHKPTPIFLTFSKKVFPRFPGSVYLQKKQIIFFSEKKKSKKKNPKNGVAARTRQKAGV